jgi:hypothetical protein
LRLEGSKAEYSNNSDLESSRKGKLKEIPDGEGPSQTCHEIEEPLPLATFARTLLASLLSESPHKILLQPSAFANAMMSLLRRISSMSVVDVGEVNDESNAWSFSWLLPDP